MKKTLYYVIAALILGASPMALTSCEDVPEPYSIPTADNGGSDDNGGNTAEATGDGTLASPYNVAAAIKYIEEGGSESADVYVKGIVVSVDEGSYDSSYGSLKYYISDDGTSSNQFRVYNGYKGPNRTKFSAESDLKAGDVVVICGNLVNYNGTKEFTTGNYVVSINDKSTTGNDDKPDTPNGEATGDGTLSNPYNSIAANNLAQSLADNAKSENVYIKGKVSSVKEAYGSQYGNGTFYISDDGTESNQFYVYRALYLENKKYTDGNTQVKVGDEVIVYGQVTKYVSSYGTTLETVQGAAYLYSLNGKTTDEGGGQTGGDETPTEGNLISNGGFETWSGDTPTGWNTNSAGNATLSQSTDAHGGSYAVSVGHKASQNKRLGHKAITLKPGTYTFSFYAKSTTADASQCRPGYVAVIDGNVDSKNYNYGSYQSLNNSSWTLITNEFTLDATTTLSLVVMNPKTTNYATAQNILIDDASLTTNDGGLAE